MTRFFRRRLYCILFFVFFFRNFLYPLYSQNGLTGDFTCNAQDPGIWQNYQDSLKNKAQTAAQPDTNFTYEKYAQFLKKVSDTSKYIVLPLNEFRNTTDSHKIVIGLRHDVDNDLNKALRFSETESNLGFRSTYFILHTAPYYLLNSGNMAVHSEAIIPMLKSMQDEKHFEIGWHNDLVTLQAVYKMDPYSFLTGELDWLRSNGISIYGTASHGSNYCYVYLYLNFYFFEECTYPVVGQFVNNLSLPLGGTMVPMIKGKLSDFGLEYEAYFLNNNKYYSDASITNGVRWNIGMLDLDKLAAGDRVIILMHPIHWHKASTDAEIESFRITGQRTCLIDHIAKGVTVEMPYGSAIDSLKPVFAVSPGAYSKVSGKLQVSGTTINDFTNPLTYVVYAENRDVFKNWTVNVTVAKNSAAAFESLEVPGFTRAVSINNETKTVVLDLFEDCDITRVTVNFELSQGARAWIGDNEQFSGKGIFDLTGNIEYKVVAEDGVTSAIWNVCLLSAPLPVEENGFSTAGFRVYPNPSDGKINMVFSNIRSAESVVEIYNIQGDKVRSFTVNGAGNFTVRADLSGLAPGIYFIRCAEFEKPVVIVIE